MGGVLAHLFAWSPAWILLWLLAPLGLPEALRESPAGPTTLTLLRGVLVVAALAWAWRGSRQEPRPLGALRGLIQGLAVLGGLLLAGFVAVFVPTREVERRCGASGLEAVVCERLTGGFAPDAPYYRLQKGRPSRALCAAMSSEGEARVWTFSRADEARPVTPTTCPPALAAEGARCFEAEWRTPNGSDYLGLIALDPACERGVVLLGRGTVVRERRATIRGFAAR